MSHGLEKGWLTFVSAGGKRRLAPFPSEWQQIPASELERLCLAARVANPPRFTNVGPRVVKRSSAKADPPPPPVTPADAPIENEVRESLVRDVVRSFAQEARRDRMPAIEAMVRLKGLLAERYAGVDLDPSTQSDLSDLRRIRRWFVEAFYFERPA